MAPNDWLIIRIVFLVVWFCMVLGCQKETRTVAELVAKSADLPGLRASKNAELQAELKRIEDEGGTPRQLLAGLPPDEQNVAAALAVVFDRNLLPSILSDCQNLFPADRFEFSVIDLRRVVAFRDGHRRQLSTIASALARPECNFGIEYDLGYNFEPIFIDEVVAASRLLAFDVAAELAEDGPAAAIKPLERLFLLIRHLANAKLLDARSKAADLRTEAIRVLEAIAQHEKTSQDELRALYGFIQDQLDQWPSDRNALIGDRAMVMHAYEGIRFRLLDWILTPEEKEAFQEERILGTLEDSLCQTADMDELYYLRAMRRLIDACDRPYYQRIEVQMELTRDLHAKRSKRDFPFAAARLFLPDLDIWQKKCALDRARCEAWALALAAAAEFPSPGYRINPHSGQEYHLEHQNGRVVMKLDEFGERDPVVPLP
ncbi:MAG: hypothetical protein JW829_11705 [Pirellulales bacterium]|nr:hypothetical protein [Pirellulales bacterium]